MRNIFVSWRLFNHPVMNNFDRLWILNVHMMNFLLLFLEEPLLRARILFFHQEEIFQILRSWSKYFVFWLLLIKCCCGLSFLILNVNEFFFSSVWVYTSFFRFLNWGNLSVHDIILTLDKRKILFSSHSVCSMFLGCL